MKRRVFVLVAGAVTLRGQPFYGPRGPTCLRQRDVRYQGRRRRLGANTETDLGRGGWVDPQRGQETFDQYAGTWMKRTDLADETQLLDRIRSA
jgi:hypothetical protein